MRGKSRLITCTFTLTTFLTITATTPAGQGVILSQDLDIEGKGFTIIRVWGSHYDMGFAQAELLGDHIVAGVDETRTYLGPYHYFLRNVMANTVWMPPGLEDEFDGMVASLAQSHPEANIDDLDLKVAATAGDWLYACRSHTCWGRYVADPVRTLSTRRLDFPSLYTSMHHHVLCARCPNDGSPRWVNLAWPGIPTAATGVNEFGTIVSLHDYNCTSDIGAGRMPRMVACRYALTYATDPDISTHLAAVYAELQTCEIMTGSFVNYYAPEGFGGVMVCHPTHSPDFYYLRTPAEEWHRGEAMITTNSWTDGTYTPADEDFGADAYYNDESPKTLENHWNLLATTTSLHQLSTAYRGRGDMTLWADGRLDATHRTPRLEWEWHALFGLGDMDCDGDVDFDDINPFVLALSGETAYLAQYPDCNWRNADCDSDGDIDFDDINAFVAILGS